MRRLPGSLAPALSLLCLLGGRSAAASPRPKTGIKADEIRDVLKLRNSFVQNWRLWTGDIRHTQTLLKACVVARLEMKHLLMQGEPGGAKSRTIKRVIGAELKKPFEIQMADDTPASVFVGGRVLEDAEKGIYKINLEGSLARHQVGVVDELEKGEGGVFSRLLDIMADRIARHGNETFPADTETVFSAMNATLEELSQTIAKTTFRPSTARALLNRFQLKALVDNWQSVPDHVHLIERAFEQRRLEALKEHGDAEAAQHHHFVATEKLDYRKVRGILRRRELIRPTPELIYAYAQLVDRLREGAVRTRKAAVGLNRDNAKLHPHIYYPSADWSTRIAKEDAEMMVAYAFVDMLLSPLLDERHIEETLHNQQVLGIDSLWRTHLFGTTIGPGEARIANSGSGEPLAGIDWGYDRAKPEEDLGRKVLDPATYDEHAENLIRDMHGEQDRLEAGLTEVFGAYQDELKKTAAYGDGTSGAPETASVEALLLKHRER